MMRPLCLALAATLLFTETAQAFCGFYVATSDQPLVNRSSRVVLAHAGARTVVTMASDVDGDPKHFAIVVPVPTVIKREQVRLVKPETVDHLAEFTKPRLVEYYDSDPCGTGPVAAAASLRMPASAPPPPAPPAGVRIEAQYSVGEYDIVVLSATDSGGLMEYLARNNYKVPPGAQPTVRSYIRQNLHFFLAKVNLARAPARSGMLRPLQVEYDSPKFMLPIRLGTVNATGPQDMIVLALGQHGRIETTNYRTARMPTDIDVPLFVQSQFGQFYDAVFDRQVERSGATAVFLEYAWNIGATMCDPCSAPPMAAEELQALGASWVRPGPFNGSLAGGAFVTRLHVRYDRDHFPEDLQLQETPDTESFQVRFVTRHPFQGDVACPAGATYKTMLRERGARAAATLADLSGWLPGLIAERMRATGEGPGE